MALVQECRHLRCFEKQPQNDYHGGKAQLSVPLSHFLKTWLADHILGTDKRFGSFLNTKGVV
jgi:hemerythrin